MSYDDNDDHAAVAARAAAEYRANEAATCEREALAMLGRMMRNEPEMGDSWRMVISWAKSAASCRKVRRAGRRPKNLWNAGAARR